MTLETPDQQQEPGTFFSWLTNVIVWPFLKCRPHFWSALFVLYFGALTIFVACVRMPIDLLFRQPIAGIDFELIGHFVGASGVGALASAPLLSANNVAIYTWLRIALFGGISGFVFGLLIEIKHGPPIDTSDCVLSSLVAAGLFLLVRWLISKQR